MKRRIKAALADQRGSLGVSVLGVFFLLMLSILVLAELGRLNTFGAQLSDATERAIISVCASNFDTTWNGLREGYSGGYSTDGSGWTADVSPGDVYAYLDARLGTQADGDGRSRYEGGKLLYRISDLQVSITNAPLAPGRGNGEQFQSVATFTLTVPLAGGWDNLPPMTIHKTVEAGFTAKF